MATATPQTPAELAAWLRAADQALAAGRAFIAEARRRGVPESALADVRAAAAAYERTVDGIWHDVRALEALVDELRTLPLVAGLVDQVAAGRLRVSLPAEVLAQLKAQAPATWRILRGWLAQRGVELVAIP